MPILGEAFVALIAERASIRCVYGRVPRVWRDFGTSFGSAKTGGRRYKTRQQHPAFEHKLWSFGGD
jgi:hypothetical protein